jgi:hypothetical protein
MRATLPTPGLMVTVVASETSQVKVEVPPDSITWGSAKKLVITGVEGAGEQPLINAKMIKIKMMVRNLILFIFFTSLNILFTKMALSKIFLY